MPRDEWRCSRFSLGRPWTWSRRGAANACARGGGHGLAPNGAPVSWLDVKLGRAMLRKHPGLTLVSVFALAIGIPVGLAPVTSWMAHGSAAGPGGRPRPVLRLWNPAPGRTEATTLRDFDVWREALTSFQALGAYRQASYNVGAEDGGGPPVRAPRSPRPRSRFSCAARSGATIDPGDEVDGAANVVVIGHDLWQSRFAGDPGIVGRSCGSGPPPHRRRRHAGGLPLPDDSGVASASDRPRILRAWRRVRVFGRLADGCRGARAQSELARWSPPGPGIPCPRRTRACAGIAVRILRLGGLKEELRTTPEVLWSQVLAWLVLFVACINVGMLISRARRPGPASWP